MLIKCPECGLQVSDKAKTCPHCGFPISQPTITSPEVTKTQYRAKHMRLPNGFGQISLIKGQNLRNPYRVMITVGKTEYGKPICKLLKPNAYFPSYKDAYEALLEYNKDPYDLDTDITMEELYDAWLPEYKKKLKSDSSVRTVTSAWVYCFPIYKYRVRSIRSKQLKDCIMNSEAPYQTKFKMKSVLNIIFDYAIESGLLDKNPARAFGLSIDDEEKKTIDHIAFTDEELDILWSRKDEYFVSVILYQCYSGWRPQELCNIKLEDVDLENIIVTGGMKTAAGTNRRVPIHHKLVETVKKIKEQAILRGSEYLICDPDGSHLTYDKYNKRFHKVMQSAEFTTQHRPHDPRKTFITMAKRANVNEYAIKRMVGHAISDITEGVYTERSDDWLRDEINTI